MKICMSTWRLPAALVRLCVAGLTGAQRSPWCFEVNPIYQSLAAHDSFDVWLQNQNTLADSALANAQCEYALVQRLAGLVQADAEQKFRRLAGMRFRPATQLQHRLSAGRRLTATRHCRLDCSLPPQDRDPSRSDAPAITGRPLSADGRSRSARFVLQ